MSKQFDANATLVLRCGLPFEIQQELLTETNLATARPETVRGIPPFACDVADASTAVATGDEEEEAEGTPARNREEYWEDARKLVTCLPVREVDNIMVLLEEYERNYRQGACRAVGCVMFTLGIRYARVAAEAGIEVNPDYPDVETMRSLVLESAASDEELLRLALSSDHRGTTEEEEN